MEHKKRICLFAGFDKNGEIADYVVYYIKTLSRITDVYYWGDFTAKANEKSKIAPYCKAIYCERHGKYDFGSWQELISKIGRKNIESYDELILANDSCYGPLFEWSDIFSKMDQCDCDFWGLSLAYRRHVHIQSYFMVLKQQVFCSETFYDFFKQVKKEERYSDVCARYEDRFTYILSKAGFSFCSYIDYGDLNNHPYNDVITAIKQCHFPLLKVKFFLGDIRDQAGVLDWRKEISMHTDYSVEIIEQDLLRRGYDLDVIDYNVKNKYSETPNLYSDSGGSLPKRILKKVAKNILKPIIYLMDKYIGNRTVQFAYKTDRLNREYRCLQRENAILQAKLEQKHLGRQYELVESSKKQCRLSLTDKDVIIARHFELELPLTDESNVLLIGNIGLHNLASLELYEPSVIFANNDWGEELQIESERIQDLCSFNFNDQTGRKIFFDFILVQPLEGHVSKNELEKFIENLKSQMIFESVLIMMVADNEQAKYEEALQSKDMCPANSERGLVVRSDPFQTYCDKISSIKGYKTLIYKIK